MKKQRIILIAAIIVVYIVCITAFLTGGFGFIKGICWAGMATVYKPYNK